MREGNHETGLGERLRQLSSELRTLEETMKSGDLDPRVLQEFRDSVDHVRQTAWAVQQWLELRSQEKDAYTVLSLLTLERIRRAAQLSRDLSMDLDATEVSFETQGLDKLYEAVRGLYERLARLFRK